MTDLNTLTLKRVQTFRSPDGGGFNADVYIDGVFVAEAHDDGNGGLVDIYWKCSPEKQAEIEAAIDALPEVALEFEGLPTTTIKQDFEWLINRAIEDFESQKLERAACKKGLCFTVKGSEGFYTTKCLNDERSRAHFEAKYGKENVTFLNDKYPDIQGPTEASLQAEKVRKDCKKGLCFKNAESRKKGPTSYFTTTMPDTPVNRQMIMAKYPDAEILNG